MYLAGELPPASSELTITATYANEAGNLRFVQKSVQLPLRMLLRPCAPETTAPFSLSIKSAEPVLSFSQIFPGTQRRSREHCATQMTYRR